MFGGLSILGLDADRSERQYDEVSSLLGIDIADFRGAIRLLSARTEISGKA